MQSLTRVKRRSKLAQILRLGLDLAIDVQNPICQALRTFLQLVEVHQASVYLSRLEFGRLLLHVLYLTRYLATAFLGILDFCIDIPEAIFVRAHFSLHFRQLLVQSAVLLALIALRFVNHVS